MAENRLTAVQEDYLETIYRLECTSTGRDIRISDIAASLGTRLPTVTRAVRRLAGLGLLRHALRGRVGLSPRGRKMAVEIVHRHEDIVTFFVDILGLRRADAESDACQMEHGLSARTAQRLHDFLEYFQTLPIADRRRLTGFLKDEAGIPGAFKTLSKSRVSGWRT